MNRYKKYKINNISFSEIRELENTYLRCVNNQYLKKVDINIKNDNLLLNIEPFYYTSDKWNKLIDVLKRKKVKFWFRDDDAGIDDDSLVKLVSYFDSKKINLFIAVIPKLVSHNLIVKLNNFDNYLIGQHGYSHTNFSQGENSEYPNTRCKDDIEKELVLGNSILKNTFQNKYIKVFVPPWFEISDVTKQIIKKLEYNAISNYWNNNVNKYNLIEANCQIDLVNWDLAYTFGGEDFVLSQLIEEIDKIDNQGYIGILLHHERTGNETYIFLDKLIKIIEKYATISNIGELILYMEKKYD